MNYSDRILSAVAADQDQWGMHNQQTQCVLHQNKKCCTFDFEWIENTGFVVCSTQQIVMGQWWEWQWHEQPCYLTVAHWQWHVTTQKERTWCVCWTSSVKLDCGTVFWLVFSMACTLCSYHMLSWKSTLPPGCRWSPSTEVCAVLCKHQAFKLRSSLWLHLKYIFQFKVCTSDCVRRVVFLL